MTNTNELIGKEIAFNIDGRNHASSYLNSDVIPKIKAAISCYDELKVLKPFSVDVFNEWIATNGDEFEQCRLREEMDNFTTIQAPTKEGRYMLPLNLGMLKRFLRKTRPDKFGNSIAPCNG